MTRTFLCLVVVLAGSLSAGQASAQGFSMDMSQMVQNELNFQNQFYSYVHRRSWELAREIPNDQPLPFNAMTISRSVSEGMRAFEGYNQAWHNNSNRQLEAVERWTDGAINGVSPYANPYTGETYNLPYVPDAYHVGPYGYIYSGYDPYNSGGNFYPQW